MANANDASQPISVEKETAPVTTVSAPLSGNHAPAVPAAPSATSEAQVFASPTDGMPAAGEKILEFQNVTKSFSDKKTKTTFDVLKRSEEHTSELQSRENLVCRLLLEK